MFRGGSKHSNHGDTARKALEHRIEDIRSGDDEDVPMVVRFDSGFFDQQLFGFREDHEVGYVATGKACDDRKRYVRRFAEETFERMEAEDTAWEVAECGDGRGSWDRFRRAFYTRPLRLNHQPAVEFHPADRFYDTNRGMGFRGDAQLRGAGPADWLEPKGGVRLAHGRGGDELNHRHLKGFGWEKLPFKNFEANMDILWDASGVSHLPDVPARCGGRHFSEGGQSEDDSTPLVRRRRKGGPTCRTPGSESSAIGLRVASVSGAVKAVQRAACVGLKVRSRSEGGVIFGP